MTRARNDSVQAIAEIELAVELKREHRRNIGTRFRACARPRSTMQAARACLSADFPPRALFPMSDEDNDRFVRTSRSGAALGMQISASFLLFARVQARAHRESSLQLAWYFTCSYLRLSSPRFRFIPFAPPLFARFSPLKLSRVSLLRYRSALSGTSTSIAPREGTRGESAGDEISIGRIAAHNYCLISCARITSCNRWRHIYDETERTPSAYRLIRRRLAGTPRR